MFKRNKWNFNAILFTKNNPNQNYFYCFFLVYVLIGLEILLPFHSLADNVLFP